MKSIVLSNPMIRTIITDVIVFLLVYLIPAFSHITPFPLYLAEPMRIIMLGGYFMSTNRINTYFIAFTIPLFSMMTTGHPVLFKSFLIGFELMGNVFFLDIFLKRWSKFAFPALITSIILSKLLYYFMKYLFIIWDLIDGKLLSTSIQLQLYSALGISFFYYLVISFRNRNKAKL